MSKFEEDQRVEKPAHERGGRTGPAGTVAGRAPVPGLGSAEAGERGAGDAPVTPGPSQTRNQAGPTGSPEANREMDEADRR